MPCPFSATCPTVRCTDKWQLVNHLQTVHVSVTGVLADQVLGDLGLWICGPCKRLVSQARTHCPSCGRDHDGYLDLSLSQEQGGGASQQTARTVLTEAEPQWSTTVEDVLAHKCPTFTHIPKPVSPR